MNHYIVTGGAGFIGSEFVRQVLRRQDTFVTVLDALTYAGNIDNLEEVLDHPNFAFYQADIAQEPDFIYEVIQTATHVVNFAAESHVDRSIENPRSFLNTGIIGVFNLVEAAKRVPKIRFLQVSTDEVYGAVLGGFAKENWPMQPRSPYAAAKAAGEHLVHSYGITYGLDYVITRGANTFGPYQYLEKMVPLFITNAIDHQAIPMYGDGKQRRDWIHVSDHAGAIEFILLNGESGETYNIPGVREMRNIDVAHKIVALLDTSKNLIQHIEDRAGHDIRYAMDGQKLWELGWENKIHFDEGLITTVNWYKNNRNWWQAIRDRGFTDWYNNRYQTKIAVKREF